MLEAETNTISQAGKWSGGVHRTFTSRSECLQRMFQVTMEEVVG